MTRRPNLLFLVHRAPFPPNRGDRIRSYHILKFLAERADVHLACLADEPTPPESLAALNELCAAVEIAPVGKERWLRGVMSLAAGRSATEGLFRSPQLARTICRWTSQTRFDAVLVFCSSMVQYLDTVGQAPPDTYRVGQAPPDNNAVVDLVDVDSQKFFDYAATAPFWKRPLYKLEGRRLRQLEKSLPGRVSAVTLVSEAEADLYRGFCPNDCTHAVENGVDLEYFTPVADAEANRCVFVGVLDYRANVEGLRWFCRHVWPEVHRRQPDATFAIVGRNPGPAVNELSRLPGVQLIGEVPDVRPHVAAAKVAIAPLQVARGVQNKVLEALAMGKPVLATQKALEGLDLTPGEDALSATTPADWITTLLHLLQNKHLRRRLSYAGRAYVEDHHSWPARLAKLPTLLGVSAESAVPELLSFES